MPAARQRERSEQATVSGSQRADGTGGVCTGEAKKAISVGRGGKAWRRAGAHAVSSHWRTGSALDRLGSSAPSSSSLLVLQLSVERPAREYEEMKWST